MNSGYEKAQDIKFFNGEFEWKKFGDNEIDQINKIQNILGGLSQDLINLFNK